MRMNAHEMTNERFCFQSGNLVAYVGSVDSDGGSFFCSKEAPHLILLMINYRNLKRAFLHIRDRDPPKNSMVISNYILIRDFERGR